MDLLKLSLAKFSMFSIAFCFWKSVGSTFDFLCLTVLAVTGLAFGSPKDLSPLKVLDFLGDFDALIGGDLLFL